MKLPTWNRYGAEAPTTEGVHALINPADGRRGGVTDAEYHGWSLPSSSFLKNAGAHRSPAHMRAWLEADPTEPTKEMRMGTLTHGLAFEPGYTAAVLPDGIDLRTKAGKAAKAEATEKAEAEGLLICKQAEWDAARRMMDSINAHPEAGEILGIGNAEASHEVAITHGGTKSKTDAVVPLGGRVAVADLKTCESAAPRDFQRAAINAGTHIQMAHQLAHVSRASARWADTGEPTGILPDGMANFCTAYVVAVENTHPHSVVVYRLDDWAIDAAMHIRDERIKAYQHAVATSAWHGYPSGVVDIDIPQWALPDCMKG
jgi:hypothetical protein